MAEIVYRTEPPDPEAFLTLFETTGWNASYRATRDELERALTASWYTLSAYDGDRLIGFGRLVSDGVLHAVVFDLIVCPTDQRRGIGAEILRRLVDRCREAEIRDVQLFAARNKGPFYERCGFHPRPDNAPGMELR